MGIDKMTVAAGFSETYQVRILTDNDIEKIYHLCVENTLFYQHCPPFCSREGIGKDLKALPPNKTYDDKYYVGFFDGGELIAVLDYIAEYPNKETAFIGFFMVDLHHQGTGVGSGIIREFAACLRQSGYRFIRLGYIKTNPQSKAFWEKNGFTPTGVIAKQELYDVVILQKEL